MPTSRHFCSRQYWQRFRVTLLMMQLFSLWQVYTMFFWMLLRKKPWGEKQEQWFTMAGWLTNDTCKQKTEAEQLYKVTNDSPDIHILRYTQTNNRDIDTALTHSHTHLDNGRLSLVVLWLLGIIFQFKCPEVPIG